MWLNYAITPSPSRRPYIDTRFSFATPLLNPKGTHIQIYSSNYKTEFKIIIISITI